MVRWEGTGSQGTQPASCSSMDSAARAPLAQAPPRGPGVLSLLRGRQTISAFPFHLFSSPEENTGNDVCIVHTFVASSARLQSPAWTRAAFGFPSAPGSEGAPRGDCRGFWVLSPAQATRQILDATKGQCKEDPGHRGAVSGGLTPRLGDLPPAVGGPLRPV